MAEKMMRRELVEREDIFHVTTTVSGAEREHILELGGGVLHRGLLIAIQRSMVSAEPIKKFIPDNRKNTCEKEKRRFRSGPSKNYWPKWADEVLAIVNRIAVDGVASEIDLRDEMRKSEKLSRISRQAQHQLRANLFKVGILERVGMGKFKVGERACKA
jgi:hypothetical protein